MSSERETSFLFLTMSENSFLYLSPLPIWVMKGCWRSWLIVHRLFTVFYRHFYTKSQ
jgi:hypothetical protein